MESEVVRCKVERKRRICQVYMRTVASLVQSGSLDDDGER
jgi:hypothetical protein